MIKNVIVTDINGNITGTTYPKRAKGLIKSGRAVEVDEQTIRLVSSVYTDAFSDDTEVFTMADIIEFKARGFKLVEDCTSNKGTRLIVTENEENVECFEIGEGGAMTKISRKIDVEKDKDYVFRFAVRSDFVKGDAESMVSIFFDEEGDGYTYPLDREDKNRFKPVICKKCADGLLRVFELPFNSGDATSATILISVHDMTAWIYPAKEKAAYDSLEDIDYEQWRQEAFHQVEKVLGDIGGTIGDTLTGIGGFVGGVGDKIGKAVADLIKSATSDDKEEEKKDEEAPAEEAGEAKAEEAPAEEAKAEEAKAEEKSGIVINGPEEDK
ncbi:MAG: hypothetical protein K5686_09475 [Lachnospiraceae bacterium]|nr:hypothetical protein [Lachnospiraceae bacterium]